MEKKDNFGYLDKGFEEWFDEIDKYYEIVKVDIDAQKNMSDKMKDNFKNSYIVNLIQKQEQIKEKIESISKIKVQKSNSGVHLKVYPKKDKFTFWENLYIRTLLGDDYAHTMTFLKGKRDVLFDYKESILGNIFEKDEIEGHLVEESNLVEDVTVIHL